MIEFLTALTPLVNAFGAIAATTISLLVLLKQTKTNEAVSEVASKVEVIHASTNSMKDELVKVTGESEYAKGLKKGEER